MRIYDVLHPKIGYALSEVIRGRIDTLAHHGCNAILWPPLLSTFNDLSYGFDPRCDLRAWQWWGSQEEILSTSDAAHKLGTMVLRNRVDRQYGPAKLPILESDPKVFPKTADCFVPPQPWDTSLKPENGANDGMIVSYLGTNGYMLKGKIQASHWLHEVLGLDGWRLDEAGGLAPSVIRAFNEAQPGFNFAEVWEGNPYALVEDAKQIGMPVLDFPGFYAYLAVSRGAPLTTLVNSGIADHWPAIKFVENFDTDRFTPIIANKLWFYVHALTVPAHGVMLYGGDYSNYGLNEDMMNIAWFSAATALGGIEYRIEEPGFLAWTRDGNGGKYGWSGGCLCAINADPIHWQHRYVRTHFQPGTVLHNFGRTLGYATPVDAHGGTWVTVSPTYFGDGKSYVLLADHRLEGWQPTLRDTGKRGTAKFTDFSGITVTR